MNPMIKGIGIIFGIGFAIVLAVSYIKSKSETEQTVPPVVSTPSDRDSESEAVRAVSTGINELRSEQDALKEDNKSLREALDNVGEKLTKLTDRLTDYASGQEEIPQTNIVGESIDTIDKIEPDSNGLGGDIYGDISDPNLIQEPDSNGETIVADTLPQYIWHTPVVLVASNQSNTNIQPSATKPRLNNENRNIIPPGAMIPSRTITALIGRIPVDGRVEEAWPFKVVATDVAHVANFYETEVHGMILEGTAVGDYSFKCVRGKIDRINITLADGRVVTTVSAEEGLGWISDAGSNPCLRGLYVSNISEHFGKQTFFEILSSAAKATARAEQTNIVSADGVTRSEITGDELRATFAEGIAGLADSAREFYEQRGDVWDAVYVEPNQKIVVHITEEVILKPDDNKQLYNRNAITYEVDNSSHSVLD